MWDHETTGLHDPSLYAKHAGKRARANGDIGYENYCNVSDLLSRVQNATPDADACVNSKRFLASYTILGCPPGDRLCVDHTPPKHLSFDMKPIEAGTAIPCRLGESICFLVDRVACRCDGSVQTVALACALCLHCRILPLLLEE